MKLWTLLIVGSFVIGIALRHKPQATRMWIMAGVCLCACIGYYFLGQI